MIAKGLRLHYILLNPHVLIIGLPFLKDGAVNDPTME